MSSQDQTPTPISPHDVVQSGIDFLASLTDGAIGVFVFCAQPDGQNIIFHERYLAADKLAVMSLIAQSLSLQKLSMNMKHIEPPEPTSREKKSS
jgi:hypothetical protein